MPKLTSTLALAALLFSSAASAAGGSAKDPGKGASGPAAGPSSSGSSGEGAPVGADGADRAQAGPTSQKPWEVGVSYEYHRLLRQEDIGGAGYNKNLSYFGFYARWDITPYDRVALRGGVYEHFLADPGETGFRFDDLMLSYTRRIPLPAEVTLRVSGALVAPTSFASQKASLIVEPRVWVGADRKFGYFTLDLRLTGRGFVCKYATPDGGANPNVRGIFSAQLSGDFSMPFHPPLSAGLSLYDGYLWYYDVSNGNAGPGMSSASMGTVMQDGQPLQQSYGGEIYVRYAFPSFHGFKADLTLAVAQGDPTLGYASVIHDGAQHVYPFYRQTGEFYGVLGARY